LFTGSHVEKGNAPMGAGQSIFATVRSNGVKHGLAIMPGYTSLNREYVIIARLRNFINKINRKPVSK
jgi:hypothetical protein